MLPSLRETLFWFAAAILAILPLALALDFGGVLWWTQYVAALGVALAFGATAAGVVIAGTPGQWRQHLLLIVLLVWLAFAWFQTIPLPPMLVGWLSPASVPAYTTWLEPFTTPATRPTSFPISLSVNDSRHAVSMLGVVVAVVWISSIVFASRARLGMLLSVLAASGAIIAALGLWRLVIPGADLWSFDDEAKGQPFSTFVNRNNAALFLNLGLGTSLGLLAWRLTALTGEEVDSPDFEWNDFLALMNDRDSLLGVVAASLCAAGLLVCGSRGGLVGAVIGLLIAFGWVRQRRGLASLPVIACVVGVCVAILLTPTDLSLKSVERLELLEEESTKTLMDDGRLAHWPDGLRAAAAHFPSGSGLATYGDAVLPHQRTSPGSGFQHADNLWVELLTEQSLVGSLLALAILALLVRALQRLSDTADPIDHGLRITGWFSVGSIVATQVFDFGLIIPPNLFAFAILFSSLLAREVAAGFAAPVRRPTEPTPRGPELAPVDPAAADNAIGVAPPPRKVQLATRKRFDTKRVLPSSRHLRSLDPRNRLLHRSAAHVIGLLPLLVLVPSLYWLRSDAETEAITSSIKTRRQWIRIDDAEQQLWIDRLTAQVEQAPSSQLFQMLSEVMFERARLSDVAETSPQTPADAARLYRATAPTRRRLAGRTPDADVTLASASPESNAAKMYRSALDWSTQAILLRPLSQTARPAQVYLDFVHGDRERSNQTLAQLQALFAREPQALLKIGTLAAEGGENKIATEIWSAAAVANPALTSQVLTLAEQQGMTDFASLVPPSSEHYRFAAQHLLARKLSDTKLFSLALKNLNCSAATTKAERARCEELAGDLMYELKQYASSFVKYRAAIDLDPLSAGVRYKLVERLVLQDRRDQALEEARKARVVLPDDKRFETIVNQLQSAATQFN